jgi:hypothetical protein
MEMKQQQQQQAASGQQQQGSDMIKPSFVRSFG